MQENLGEFTARSLPIVETALRKFLPQSSLPGTEKLNSALVYVVNSGGKRTRSLLALAAGGIFDAGPEDLEATACAVEFLHLSSVIFDDLPGMDDAHLRRHLPALHLVFGEGIAILAALALYSKAFELLAATEGLAARAARAVGSEGMTGGQAADLAAVSPSRLQKTAGLMRLALEAGGIAACAPAPAVESLGRCGQLLGEAYQISDDLLDVLASETLTGKTSGQDLRHGRMAVGPAVGFDFALKRVTGLVRKAIDVVEGELPRCSCSGVICEFAQGLVERVTELVEKNGAISSDAVFPGDGGGQRSTVAAPEARQPIASRTNLGSDSGAK